VVQAWLSRHQRWGSPVILCGESYGTTRVAALAEALGEAGVALAGVVLVSCALDLQALDFLPRNDLPYATFLPAFAGTAQFHGCLKGSLGQSGDAARAAAQEFVDADYLRALHLGARLAPKEQARVARRLAQLTGLPQAFIEQQQLRISDQQFFSELLRPRGQVVGRMDGRVAGPMPARQTPFADLDPSLDTCWAPSTTSASSWGSTPSASTCCIRPTQPSSGTGTGASVRAMPSPAPPPTWPRPCVASPICACWWPAACLTWPRPTAPPAGRWTSWTWRRPSGAGCATTPMARAT
jgi:hypothetical protein